MSIRKYHTLEEKKAAQAAASKRYKQRHPERVGKSRRRLRDSVLALLGSVCTQCGFSDVRALQVDHINGGGHKERAEKGWVGILRDILKYGPQNKYQLLCANCNAIKRIVNKEHGWGKT